jgi:hypothetical protein
MENAENAYTELAAYLGSKQERPWGNNTRVYTDGTAAENAPIIVRLHNTEIAHLYADGSITLNAGGWLTPTTKDRLNKVLALAGGKWRIFTEKSLWHVFRIVEGVPWNERPSYPFADGVTVWPDGRIEGQAPEPPTKLRKAAKAYVNKLVTALFDGSLPAPDSGDCRFCRGMFGDVGERDDDHIKSHIEENYLVPSLLWNVINNDTVKMGPWPRQYAANALWKRDQKVLLGLEDTVVRQLKRVVWVHIATRIGLPT